MMQIKSELDRIVEPFDQKDCPTQVSGRLQITRFELDRLHWSMGQVVSTGWFGLNGSA
jgi:hypothetical protein